MRERFDKGMTDRFDKNEGGGSFVLGLTAKLRLKPPRKM